MKKEVKQKWVEALRSGEYKQGRGKLHPTEDTYCCLGVLTDLCAKEKGLIWEQVTKCEIYHLPATVMEWAAIDCQSPRIDGVALDMFNDGNDYVMRPSMNFSQIADVIGKSNL